MYLTSKQADIGAAATKALEIGDVFPEDPTASFANVNLYDQPGAQTWPITMVTYLYLQSNYSTMEITNAALLKAFVQFMISKEGQSYGLENLFDAMPQELIDLAKLGIASVTWPVNMTDFVFETDYLPARSTALAATPRQANFNLEWRGAGQRRQRAYAAHLSQRACGSPADSRPAHRHTAGALACS